MDIDFILKYIPKYLLSLCVALKLSFVSVILAIFLGLACAIVLYNKVPFLNLIVKLYIEISRNTPLIVQLFFLYFGLPRLGLKISAKVCSIIGLCFLGTSYMAESIRSGFDRVEKLQIESAYALGLSKMQIMFNIIIPEAWITSMSSVFSNVVFLFKETSVLSAIAISDPIYVTKDLIGIYHKTNEGLFLLIFSYLLVLLPFNVISNKLKRGLNYGGSWN